MPIIKVLLDEKGDIVGTAYEDAGAQPATSDQPAPHAALVPGARQRVVELQVGADEAAMDAQTLHHHLAGRIASAG